MLNVDNISSCLHRQLVSCLHLKPANAASISLTINSGMLNGSFLQHECTSAQKLQAVTPNLESMATCHLHFHAVTCSCTAVCAHSQAWNHQTRTHSLGDALLSSRCFARHGFASPVLQPVFRVISPVLIRLVSICLGVRVHSFLQDIVCQGFSSINMIASAFGDLI